MSMHHLGAEGEPPEAPFDPFDPFDPFAALRALDPDLAQPEPIAIVDTAAADGASGGTIEMLPGASFERGRSAPKLTLWQRIKEFFGW